MSACPTECSARSWKGRKVEKSRVHGVGPPPGSALFREGRDDLRFGFQPLPRSGRPGSRGGFRRSPSRQPRDGLEGAYVSLDEAGNGRFLALIGIDLMEPPGKAPLSVVADRDGTTARLDLELAVRERAFPVQVLSLPKKMAEFDAGTLEGLPRGG